MIAKQELAWLGTGPLSTEPYVSPAYHELERERIFRRVWLFACRDEEVPNVGDYIVKDYGICGASVLIVRGRDGRVRALHNVCTHRQAKLVWDERGNARHFSCAYHGWGYGLDGSLKTVPDAESFHDLDLARCGLAPIHLDRWNGFLFVNFAAQPEQTLLEHLGPIVAKLGEHRFGDRPTCVTMSAELPANWKATLDNFQETYHLEFIHRYSVGDRAVSPENPHGHPLEFDFFGPHRFMSIWGNPGHKQAQVESLAARHGGISGAGAAQHTAHYRGMRHPNWQLDVHGIFPNLLIEVAPTFFYAIELIPLSLERTRWVSHHYLPRAETSAQRFAQQYNLAAYRDTVAEDLGVVSTLQAAMKSGARKEILFQAHEILCRHTYHMVDRYVRHGGPGQD